MRVSNVSNPYFRPAKILDKPEGGFSDLLALEIEEMTDCGELSEEMTTRDGRTIRLSYGYGSEEYDPENLPEHIMIIKCKAWGRQFDTNEELSRYYPHCSLPMEADLVHVDLSALTDEIKAELNAKYQINNIKPYSKEYFALMKDLQEVGVLSDGNAYKLPPNMRSLAIDENGRVKSFSIQYLFENSGKNANFLDYAKNTLSFVADDFEDMKTWDWLTDEEQMAISIYEMNQSIVAAIENIFSGPIAKASLIWKECLKFGKGSCLTALL